MKDPIIEIVDLNSLNQLQVTLNEFQGKQRLDIRHWYREGMLSDNEWKPSKKGVNIGIGSFSEFRKALDRVFSAFMTSQEMAEEDEAMESLKCPKCGELYGDGLNIDGEMAKCLACGHRWEYEL